MKNYIIIILLIIFSHVLYSQTQITVEDKKNATPLPFARICTENTATGAKKYQVTDKFGKIEINTSAVTLVAVSYTGYSSILDTIQSGTKTKTYQLEQTGFDVDQVVVTGQHKPIAADKSIYKIKLVDKSEISRKGATNMAELLKNELNISVTHDPSTGSGMKLQGISGNNVKILIDGVPVIGRLNGNIDLTQIDMSNVDHVEIVEGPMSVIYGSNALAGVINIITKTNRYAKFKANLTTYYENVGMYNANGSVDFRKNRHSFHLNFGRNFFGGYDTDTSSRSAEYKPKEQYNGGFAYNFIGSKIDVKVKTNYFNEKLLDRSDLITTPYFIKGYETWFLTQRVTNELKINHKLNQNSSYSLMGAYSYYFREKKRYIKDMTNLETELSSSASDHDTTTFDAIVSRGIYNWHSTNKKIDIQAGFDIDYEHGTGKRMKDQEQYIADYAVFSGLIWNITHNLSFQPGVRLAYNTKYKAPIVPSANIKYSLKKLNIRASYARGFRAPSLKELYLYFYDSNHQIEGNDELKAEYSHNYHFSSDYSFLFDKNKLTIGLSAFYNDINDMITLVQVDAENDLHYSNQNMGHFESVGGELSAEYVFDPLVSVKIGFHRLGRTNLDNNNKFIYNNNLSSNLNFNFLKNTATFSIFYKYFGKYPFYTYYDELELNYLDNYHNLDLSLSKSFLKNKLIVTAGAKNLFDNSIISGNTSTSGAHGSSSSVSSLAGWGRTFFLSLKYNIIKY